MKKNIFKKIAFVIPVLTLGIASVASVQAETSKYRFSDQYQERIQANLKKDRAVSTVTDKVGLNKKNRNGKSKYRFSEKRKSSVNNISSDNAVFKSVGYKVKHRNGKTSKFRFVDRS
ncbi:MAG: hypothetical protein ACRBBR_08385 [Cellvibrionaceae bacterium]